MKRTRTLAFAVLAVTALVAGACGSPDGALRALPGGSGGQAEEAVSLAADASTTGGGGWARYQPTTYVLAEGVRAPKTAPAYELSGSAPTKGQVERLATALGLNAKVQTEKRAFLVEDGDVVLEVRRSALGAWSVTNEGAHRLVESCAHAVDLVDPVTPDGGVSSSPEGQEAVRADDCPAPPPAQGLLSQGEAQDRVRAILQVGGSAAFDYEVTDGDSSDRTTSVSVAISYRGHQLDELSTWWEFGEKGQIINGMGFFASPESLGDYPLVTAAQAVERLNAQERGDVGIEDSVGVPAPQPRPAGDVATSGSSAGSSGSASAPSEPAVGTAEPAPCPPEADCAAEPVCGPEDDCAVGEPLGEPEPLEPREVAVTSISLAYALVPTGLCEDDAVLLVPQLELETDDIGSVWVEALTDEHLLDGSSGDDVYDDCPEDTDGQEPGRTDEGVPTDAEPVEPTRMPAEVEPLPAPATPGSEGTATTSR